MKWLKSLRDIAVDLTAVVVIEVGALVDEWRYGR